MRNQMRKLCAFNLISADGYFEGPDHELDWHNVDEEFNVFAIKQLDESDTLLFGRVTYQMMESYWTTPMAIEDDPIVAGKMNSMSKVVVSKTMNNVGWDNTKLMNKDIPGEILKLKRQPGKDILLLGSSRLMSSLLRYNLIDEIRIMVNPVFLGRGRTLFQEAQEKLNLKLIDSRTFKSGNILLVYKPD